MAEENISSIADPLWKEKRYQERFYEVFTLRRERFGRCCLDMPDERDWPLIDLWWLSLDVYKGLLITTAQGKGKYVRVGNVWFHDPMDLVDGVMPPKILKEEYEEIILL
jgi:hypothetical protein